MFGWLKTGLSAISNFFGWANNKQLLDAGEDRANARNSRKVLENVKTAKEAVDGLDNNDERERVRDKFSRD